MSALAAPFVGYDILRDARHRNAASARAVADWLAHLELRNLSPRTLDLFERTVAALLRNHPDKLPDEFTSADINHTLRSWPPRSRRVRRTALNSFVDYCLLANLMSENVMQLVPKQKPSPKKLPAHFTVAEVERLCALPDPDGPLMDVLFSTGIRKGEARRLLVRHIKLESSELVVYDGKGGKDRMIVTPLRLQRRLAAWFLLDALEPDDHLWYSRPGAAKRLRRDHAIADSTWHYWWIRCLMAASVEHRKPHATRHTYALLWKRTAGRLETLRDQLGHSSIAVTADLYGKLEQEDVRNDVALFETAWGE